MGDNKKFSEIIAIEVLEENESRTKKKIFFQTHRFKHIMEHKARKKCK